jgi:hypothetical protein
MRSIRAVTVVVALVAIAGVVAGCAPPVPEQARRVSPADGTGYVDPIISGDGDTVLYRREADRSAGFDVASDLVVTRVSAGTTTVVPGVRTVHAVSADGTAVVHGYGELTWTDTTTGDSRVLYSGWTTGFGAVDLSDDGRSVAWLERREVNGFCPCELWLTVQRDGVEVLEQLLDTSWSGSGDQFHASFVSIDRAGDAVYVHRFATREVVRIDVATGAATPVALQLPPIPDPNPYSSLESYLRFGERIDVGAADGSSFRLVQMDEPYLVRPDAPPLALPSHGISDPSPSISPNGRWIAYIDRTPTLPGQERRSYRVRDLVTGTTREVVASDAASDPAFEPASTFNGWGSVADTGRATFGHWAAPLSGPWPPSVVYVDD